MNLSLDTVNYKKNDAIGMLGSLENFPELCQKAWDISKRYSIPSYFVKSNKFVIAGMGASGISGDIIKSIIYKTPVIIESVHDYELPGWVDGSTIVIICSHSGNTEESLAAFLEASQKGAKIIAIGSGGKLEVLAEKFKSVFLKYESDYPPRATFPYLFMILLSVFTKLGYFELNNTDYANAIDFLKKYRDRFKIDNKTETNPAKLLAKKLTNKLPIVYGGGIMIPVSRRFKCQINENAKTFASYDIFPELNHNAIEGLSHPKEVFIILLESNYGLDMITKRQEITSKLLTKNKILFEKVKFAPYVNQLGEILVMVLFGDYVSYYLGFLYNEQIDKNINIDYLKSQLGH